MKNTIKIFHVIYYYYSTYLLSILTLFFIGLNGKQHFNVVYYYNSFIFHYYNNDN